jgi:hypothetical protein
MATRFCPKCLRTSVFETILRFDDGAEGLQCTSCHCRFLLHQCDHHYPISQPSLLPLALGAMSVICPECRTLYNFGATVARFNPQLGKGIMALALLLFGAVALDKLTSRPKGRSKRH